MICSRAVLDRHHDWLRQRWWLWCRCLRCHTQVFLWIHTGLSSENTHQLNHSRKISTWDFLLEPYDWASYICMSGTPISKQMCHPHEHLNVDRTTNCLGFAVSLFQIVWIFPCFFCIPQFQLKLLDWEPTLRRIAATRYEKLGSCALNLHGPIVRLEGDVGGPLRPSCLWVDFNRL